MIAGANAPSGWCRSGCELVVILRVGIEAVDQPPADRADRRLVEWCPSYSAAICLISSILAGLG